LIQWKQWADGCSLYIAGSTDPGPGGKGRLITALWRDGEWHNVTESIVPEHLQPNEMEFIAIWSEMPKPDLKLLKDQK
jgi:hypothetical protein